MTRSTTRAGRARGSLARGLAAAALAAVLVAPAIELGALSFAPTAVAATPAPSEPGVGDTRSSGEGAGFVGQPLVAIGLVVVVGLAAAGATLVYVRLTASRRR